MQMRQGFTVTELLALRQSSGPARPAVSRAFSLVELLVVVTMIVVLLALLAPAMDQAIYQAELVVCGARLHAVGGGVHLYAMNHKRRYPYRPGVHHPKGDLLQSWRDTSLVTLPPFAPAPDGYDDRPIIRDYLSINGSLNCPLAADLDLSGSTSNTYSNYQLFYGLRFVEGATSGLGGGTEYGGMMKIGDRLQWQDARFNILASEEDDILEGINVMSAHPDKEGRLSLVAYQDVDVDGSHTTPTGPGGSGAHFTFSRWQRPNNPVRGPIDRHFLYGDGSVQRINDLTISELRDEQIGQKRSLRKVPIYSGGGGWPTQYSVLPTTP